MTQLLDGIRVIEVAMYAFVPSCGAALADWGTDVIKIEHPQTGVGLPDPGVDLLDARRELRR